MKLPKRYKLRKFLFLSFLIHLMMGLLAWNLFFEKKKIKTPIRVKLVEIKREKKEDTSFLKGEIFEIPKPEKKEKPSNQAILSEYDSKAHDNHNLVEKDKYKLQKPISPKSKIEPKPVIKKKKPINSKKNNEIAKSKERKLKKKSKKKTIISKKRVKKNKPEMENKIPEGLKGLLRKQDDLIKNDDKEKSPIFQGFEPEKFAKLGDQNKKDELDTETVYLNSRKFKYLSYFVNIKKRIEKVWSNPQQGLKGELMLQFTISNNGKLIDISIVTSSGYKVLDGAALDAVISAAPYDSFPPTIQKKKLRIIASFTYTSSYTIY